MPLKKSTPTHLTPSNTNWNCLEFIGLAESPLRLLEPEIETGDLEY